MGPGGKLPVDTVFNEDTMKYTVHYTPDKVGPVLITVKYAGNEVIFIYGSMGMRGGGGGGAKSYYPHATL